MFKLGKEKDFNEYKTEEFILKKRVLLFKICINVSDISIFC